MAEPVSTSNTANGDDPVCSRCHATSSLMWHRGEEGEVVCLGCHSAEKSSKSSTMSETSSQNGHSASNQGSTPPRRNTRLRDKGGRTKQSKGGEKQRVSSLPGSGSRAQQMKSRRTILKQRPVRAAKSQPTIVTSDSVIHKVGYGKELLISDPQHFGDINTILMGSHQKCEQLTCINGSSASHRNLIPRPFVATWV